MVKEAENTLITDFPVVEFPILRAARHSRQLQDMKHARHLYMQASTVCSFKDRADVNGSLMITDHIIGKEVPNQLQFLTFIYRPRLNIQTTVIFGENWQLASKIWTVTVPISACTVLWNLTTDILSRMYKSKFFLPHPLNTYLTCMQAFLILPMVSAMVPQALSVLFFC